MGEWTTPPKSTMFWRAARRRCPVCGSGHLFRRWFSMQERCPRCHIRLERVEGSWSGSVGLNTVVTFTCLFLALIIGFFATWPDVSAGTLLLIAGPVALLVPILFLPFSKTLWLAVELSMRPLAPGETS
jgi:uncharacterized protein (DUF983 family)